MNIKCILISLLTLVLLAGCGPKYPDGPTSGEFVKWDSKGITVLVDDEQNTYSHGEESGYRLYAALKPGDPVSFTVKSGRAEDLQRTNAPEACKTGEHRAGVIVSFDNNVLTVKDVLDTYGLALTADTVVEDMTPGYVPAAGDHVEYVEEQGNLLALRYWYDTEPMLY